ncbi:hypothetical protein ABEB36_015423 [Hypothenemus hampei]|uniref:Carboxylesterase type B domain-containing protein n=1 Tax=Hypothenemus hampei TaxID=57062 RepID=A0ABD1E0F8_HYPHA
MILVALTSLFFTLIHSSFQYNETVYSRVKRIVGGETPNYPPFDDPVVYVRFSERSARIQGTREFPHYVFKGIKYAHPPIGPDRFLRPKQKILEGDIKAITFAPPCIQPVPGKNYIIGSEDCLALNIFTPDLPTGTEGLPVVVWIHGGGFRYGSASQYGVRHLVGQRLLVVTIQYRLGSLGFLSSGSKHLPGNAALWDMALAVQWVRNYIGFFGGNPHRIIVMGHDTGASSALLLSLNKVAKGMPDAVVAMSGTAVSRWSIDNTPTDTSHQIAMQNGCPTSNDVTMIKCLQKVPVQAIIKLDSQIEFQQLQSRGFVSGLNGRLGTAPVVEGVNDGRSLPGLIQQDPVDSLYKQDNPKIPLLTGVTKDETTKAVKGHFKSDVLKQLNSVPDFLNKLVKEGLYSSPVISKLSGKLDKLGNVSQSWITDGSKVLTELSDSYLPSNFQNYLKTQNNIVEKLNKVSEATADALFNVPAFLTAQLWKDAPTYLYSFEHAGNMARGWNFLQGLPLIGNSSNPEEDRNLVGHGDELAYLFDPQDMEGKPIRVSKPSKDDVKVRAFFTKMIADFARHGEFSVDNKKVPKFNAGDNNFVQIRAKPSLADKFKFCEMALWTNIAERLKSSYCQFLGAVPGVLPNLNVNKPLSIFGVG